MLSRGWERKNSKKRSKPAGVQWLVKLSWLAGRVARPRTQAKPSEIDFSENSKCGILNAESCWSIKLADCWTSKLESAERSTFCLVLCTCVCGSWWAFSQWKCRTCTGSGVSDYSCVHYAPLTTPSILGIIIPVEDAGRRMVDSATAIRQQTATADYDGI